MNQDQETNEIQLAKLEAILSSAVDAIITIDQLGLITSVNPSTERMFGYSPDELIGRNIKMLMPSPYREGHDQYIYRYLDTGEKQIIGIGREVTGLRKDGSTFPMHLAVSEFELAGRHYFTGIVRDITDLKRVEWEFEQLNNELEQRVRDRTRELRQAQADLVRTEKLATLGKVAGNIAHEIRNPLSAVKTSAYFLLHAQNPSEEKVREHLERIDRQVTLIDNVITALSDVAKMPAPRYQPCDLRENLEQVLRSVNLPDNVQVDLQIQSALPRVWVDPNQISIAFRNLIRNARDAMPRGGDLTIAARQSDNEILVFVDDTGTGISADDLPKIREPFFTTKARGMGLGLAITSAIVEKNRGRLEIESELGRGSRFAVYLPSSPPEQVAVHDGLIGESSQEDHR